MAAIRAYLALSVDGFIADAQGGVGWLEAFDGIDVDYEAFLAEVDVIVSGRTTYEQVVGFTPWPYPGKRVVVMTRSKALAMPAGDEAVTFTQESIPALAQRLRREADGDIWLLGGGELVRGFMAAGVVDTLELYMMPVLLGSGVPLFASGGAPGDLILKRTREVGKGVVELIYQIGEGHQIHV